MNRIKKWIAFTVAVICILTCTGISVNASEVQKKSSMDVVLVIDVSGSMKQADPGKVALDGAKLFIDMMESAGSRAGIVAFSHELVLVTDMTDIKANSDKKALKESIGTLEFSGDTDIGMALQKAVDILGATQDTDNKKAILFFTDGKIDLPKGLPSEAEAEVESLKATEAAVVTAASTGIPIYTIGLNTTGIVDSDLISRIASSTGAKNYIVNAAGDLPGIYNDIFADFVETEISELGDIKITDEEKYEEKPFNIPNDSVLEANVVMIIKNEGNIKDVQLTKPDGTTVLPDEESLFLSKADNYNMLKVIGPEAGDWELNLKGDQGCEIHVNLLFNYDVVMEVSSEPDEEGNLEVSATLTKKDQPLSDPALYGQLAAKVNVTREDGETTDYPMELSDTVFACTVPVEAGEKISAVVHLEGANLYRDSEPIEYENTTKPVLPAIIQKQDLPTIELKGFLPFLAKGTLELSDYFGMEDGTELNGTYSAHAVNANIAEASVQGSELQMKGKGKGRTIVEIQVVDGQGNILSAHTNIDVLPVLANIIPLIAGAVLILAIIIFLIVRRLMW